MTPELLRELCEAGNPERPYGAFSKYVEATRKQLPPEPMQKRGTNMTQEALVTILQNYHQIELSSSQLHAIFEGKGLPKDPQLVENLLHATADALNISSGDITTMIVVGHLVRKMGPQIAYKLLSSPDMSQDLIQQAAAEYRRVISGPTT